MAQDQGPDDGLDLSLGSPATGLCALLKKLCDPHRESQSSHLKMGDNPRRPLRHAGILDNAQPAPRA